MEAFNALPAWQRLRNILARLGYEPEVEIGENSPPKEFFNVAFTESGGRKYAPILMGGILWEVDLSPGVTHEEIAEALEFLEMARPPSTTETIH